MLQYCAIVGLLVCSIACGGEAKLQIRATGSVSTADDDAQIQGKFISKPGAKLSLAVHNAVETRFEFLVKQMDREDVNSYMIDIVITRDGKVISRPTVQTIEGCEAGVTMGGEKQPTIEFWITIEPAK